MATKLVVLYGVPQDTEAFDAHYAGTHAPLAEQIPGMTRFEHGPVLGAADGSTPQYHYIAELHFDSPEALQAGMGSAEGQAAAGDVPNFATGGATLLIAQA